MYNAGWYFGEGYGDRGYRPGASASPFGSPWPGASVPPIPYGMSTEGMLHLHRNHHRSPYHGWSSPPSVDGVPWPGHHDRWGYPNGSQDPPAFSSGISWGGPPMAYGAPPLGFGLLPMGSQGPRMGFQGPRTGFQGPRMGFQDPRTGFQAPRTGFQAPRMGYQGPPTADRAPLGPRYLLPSNVSVVPNVKLRYYSVTLKWNARPQSDGHRNGS